MLLLFSPVDANRSVEVRFNLAVDDMCFHVPDVGSVELVPPTFRGRQEEDSFPLLHDADDLVLQELL